MSDSRKSPDSRESCESIRANHATKCWYLVRDNEMDDMCAVSLFQHRSHGERTSLNSLFIVMSHRMRRPNPLGITACDPQRDTMQKMLVGGYSEPKAYQLLPA